MIEEREDFIALLKEKSYRRGDFTLSSGKKSEHYINCKPATLQSDALLFISWCILECLEEDTVSLNEQMIEEGYAHAYDGGTKDMNLEALREIRRQHGTLTE